MPQHWLGADEHTDHEPETMLNSAIRSVPPARIGEPYSFVSDRARKLLVVQFEGLWSVATLETFVRDLQTEVAKLGCAPGQHVLLFDTRMSSVQPGEILQAGQKMLEAVPNKARRIATVLGSGLVRVQTRRVSVAPHLSLFDDMDEARRWLLTDD